MDKSEAKSEGFISYHIGLGVIPVLCLAMIMWIVETKSGPMQLRAAHSSSSQVLKLQGHPLFEPVEDESEEIVEKDHAKFVYSKTLTAKVTAYTPGEESCGEYADGLTSIGHNAWALDGVAADPSVLPYGTIVFIPGVGYREVDDTGIAMRTAWKKDRKVHIDLRFANVAEARKWGVQLLPIHIFKPE